MAELATVFGGTGFVGSQIVRALAKRGWRIRVASRRPGRGYALRMLGDVGQIEVVQANLREPQSLARALDGAGACINAVGVLHEVRSQTFGALHVEGARLVAETAAARGVQRLVHISAIGASAASPAAYARTKAQGEAAARGAFPGAAILRPSVVFGAGDAFFNRFAAMAEVSPALSLIGGGKTRFQPVFVGDVAAAVASALALPLAAGETFELGGPSVYEFEALMRLMLAEIGRRRWLISVPFGAAAVLGRIGDLMARTGLIAPPITFDQVQMLKTDSVVAPGMPGLTELGVAPTAVEAIIPTYLWRYRKGGQYAEATLAAAALPPR